MMSKKILWAIVAIVSGLLLFSSCKKNQKEQSVEEKICDIAKSYVMTEMKVNTVDSVQIEHIDSINKYRYTMAALNFLRESQRSLEQSYNAAIQKGDTVRMQELESTTQEVNGTVRFLEECQERYVEQDTKYIMYLVSAYYFSQGKQQGVMFFLTPDYKIHTFDPMDTRFVE